MEERRSLSQLWNQIRRSNQAFAWAKLMDALIVLLVYVSPFLTIAIIAQR
jgi:hypothetical protein